MEHQAWRRAGDSRHIAYSFWHPKQRHTPGCGLGRELHAAAHVQAAACVRFPAPPGAWLPDRIYGAWDVLPATYGPANNPAMLENVHAAHPLAFLCTTVCGGQLKCKFPYASIASSGEAQSPQKCLPMVIYLLLDISNGSGRRDPYLLAIIQHKAIPGNDTICTNAFLAGGLSPCKP
eukprot:891008-Pelagomonas_calceolata.AAC.6